MKSFYVKDGEIRVPVEALGQDPDVARAVAKEVIFDEMLLTAIVSLALTGECDCRSVNFERLRLRIIEVAPEAAKKVAEELVELRDRAQAERNEYQTRAWQAENFLRAHKGWIEDIHATKEHPAHHRQEPSTIAPGVVADNRHQHGQHDDRDLRRDPHGNPPAKEHQPDPPANLALQEAPPISACAGRAQMRARSSSSSARRPNRLLKIFLNRDES